MKKIVRTISLMIISLAVFAGGLWIEGHNQVEAATAFEQDVIASSSDTYTILREGEGQEVNGRMKLKKGDEVRVGATGTVSVKFDDNGEIRLSANSSMAYSGLYEDGYVFTVKGGRVWSNNLYTTSGLNIVAGGAIIIPQKSVVDVKYNGGITDVAAIRGHFNVGLIGEDYVIESVVYPRNEKLINSFLVAQGGQAEVSYNKVVQNKDILSRLLYSKLIKEFKYGLYNKSILSGDLWISQNIKQDDDLTLMVEEGKKDKIMARGLKYSSLESLGYQLDKVLTGVGEKLTFVDAKQKERLESGIFDHILDAEYLAVYGRTMEEGDRISIFKQLFAESFSSGQADFRNDLIAMVQREYDRLNFVVPGHELAEVKTVLSDLLISYGGGNQIEYKLDIIRDYINYAFVLADDDVLTARISLDTYFTKLRDLLSSVKSDNKGLAVLMAEENQIMDSLLKQYPEFYSDSVFAMKSFVEGELLKLIADGEAKNEEQQTMISTKIDFLKNLQNYFLAQEVSLEDARDIALRLVNEIRDMQGGNEVAVNQLFALRLKDYGNFLRFLNTTTVSTLRGASPKSSYQEFLDNQKEQVSIEQAINEFVGLPEGEMTTDKIVAGIKTDFADIGITDLQLATLGSTEQKVIGIEKGTYSGIEFNGLYDWSRKLLLEVNVKGETVNQASIRLNSLPLVLEANKSKTSSVPNVSTPVQPAVNTRPEVKEPTVEQLSKAEKVARILFIQKLKSNGITVEDSNITIKDVDKQLYAVENAELVSDKKIKVSFDYDNRNDVVSDFEILTADGIQVTNGTYTLNDVAGEAVNLAELIN